MTLFRIIGDWSGRFRFLISRDDDIFKNVRYIPQQIKWALEQDDITFDCLDDFVKVYIFWKILKQERIDLIQLLSPLKMAEIEGV